MVLDHLSEGALLDVSDELWLDYPATFQLINVRLAWHEPEPDVGLDAPSCEVEKWEILLTQGGRYTIVSEAAQAQHVFGLGCPYHDWESSLVQQVVKNAEPPEEAWEP